MVPKCLCLLKLGSLRLIVKCCDKPTLPTRTYVPFHYIRVRSDVSIDRWPLRTRGVIRREIVVGQFSPVYALTGHVHSAQSKREASRALMHALKPPHEEHPTSTPSPPPPLSNTTLSISHPQLLRTPIVKSNHCTCLFPRLLAMLPELLPAGPFSRIYRALH